MIVSKTPLRISFVGGGTDFSSFYKKNSYGLVVSASIDKYIYISVKKLDPVFHEKFRLNYSETEMVDQVENIKNPIIRECIKFLNIDDRLYISTIADVPSSTGLGSSSSFTVGLLNALYDFKKQKVSPGRIAEEAAHIEIKVLDSPIGKQDHYVASFGGLNKIFFFDNDEVKVEKIKIPKKNLNLIFGSLLLFWTGMHRNSESVLIEQEKNHNKNKNVLSSMKNTVNQFIDLVKSKKISLNKIGNLLDKNWEFKKQLADNVSNKFINNCYTEAKKRGSLGGKILGAGNGGFLLLLAKKTNHKKIQKSLKKFGLERYSFKLENSGSRIIDNF